MKRPKPRDYQVEALKWALERDGAVICMPTGTGKTLIAGLWAERLLREGKARKILFLEPTRFLVEQVASYLRGLGLPAAPLHGSLPPPARERAWRARIVVATPEIVVAEWSRFVVQGFDAVVVDECHHTTGQDPYKIVMKQYRFRYRLGLTALVPRGRRREIEKYIGEIRCWSWDHPSIRKYMPGWASEIYEAPLNSAERSLYEAIEERWARARGAERALLGSALRWLARDGAEALRETLGRSEKLRRLLEGLESLVYSGEVRPAHKLETLHRVLEDHEGYEKAIIFVDRVVIARIIASALGPRTALLLGRRHIHPAVALEKARRPETRHVVASSAGEEGIDMPEADLLVLWSNTASPLRFIQRLGRVLRPKPGWTGQKFVVFIVTPDTVDVDSLLDGITLAERSGVHVNVSREAVERLISLSRRRRILQVLEQKALPADMIAQALDAPLERIEAGLRWLLRNGLAGYIHTWLGRVYYSQSRVDLLYRDYRECLTPVPGTLATVTVSCDGENRTAKNAPYDRARRLLLGLVERCDTLGPVRASVMVNAGGGLVRMVNRQYNYVVSTREAARAIADNIYSTPKCLA